MLNNELSHRRQSVANSPFFQGLESIDITHILQHAHSCTIPYNHTLFYEGETAVSCYLIQQGQIHLSQTTPEGKQIIIHLLGPGDIITLPNAFNHRPNYSLAAKTIATCKILVWEPTFLLEMMHKIPQLAINETKIIAARLLDLQNRYCQLATEKVEKRIARTLLRIAKTTSREVDGGLLLDLPLTRQTVAEISGTTLYTVSRTYGKWESQGIISKGRENLTIHNFNALATIIK